MDVVNAIAAVPTNYNDRPLETQRMKKVTVETLVRNIQSQRSADFKEVKSSMRVTFDPGIII